YRPLRSVREIRRVRWGRLPRTRVVAAGTSVPCGDRLALPSGLGPRRLIATHGRMTGRPPGGNAARDPGHVVEPGAPQDRGREAGAQPGRADRHDRMVARKFGETIRQRTRSDVDAARHVRCLVLVRLADVDDERRV